MQLILLNSNYQLKTVGTAKWSSYSEMALNLSLRPSDTQSDSMVTIINMYHFYMECLRPND